MIILFLVKEMKIREEWAENWKRLREFVEEEFAKLHGMEFKEEFLHHFLNFYRVSILESSLYIHDLSRKFKESKTINDVIVKEVQKRAYGDILDVGCGDGVFSASIGAKVGIDADEKIIKIAQKVFPHIRFYNMRAETMKFNERFHTVIFNLVFHELEDKKKALIRCKSYLTSDGKILFVEPRENIQSIEESLSKINFKVVERKRLGYFRASSELFLIEARKKVLQKIDRKVIRNRFIKKVENFAKEHDFDFVEERKKMMIDAFVENFLKYEDFYCPCKLELNADTVCPCKWIFQDIQKTGMCECRFFKKRES